MIFQSMPSKVLQIGIIPGIIFSCITTEYRSKNSNEIGIALKLCHLILACNLLPINTIAFI